MSDKTHKTAIVIIPPEEAWAPIQAIRRVHDRQHRRWMPHVTLIYPFRPRPQFDTVLDELTGACRTIQPFDITATELRAFAHRSRRSTMYLVPEPAGPIITLHGALLGRLPDCDDTAHHKHGFTPHLSVGQSVGKEATRDLIDALNADWQKLSFPVSQISLIWRNDYPDDTFRIAHHVALGA